jgi:hypothetical protein
MAKFSPTNIQKVIVDFLMKAYGLMCIGVATNIVRVIIFLSKFFPGVPFKNIKILSMAFK